MSEKLGKAFRAKELRDEGALNLRPHKFAFRTMAVSLDACFWYGSSATAP